MSPPRLAFAGVIGGYGTAPVVREVSGQVARGEVLCVLGRNGTGKTTLMRLLMGYLPCWQGSVRLDGIAIEALATPARRVLGISYCPQERPVFDDLSVRDNLTLMRPDRDLARRLEQHAGTLSGGEKKLLSLTRGLAEAQPLVLLDEPSEGVQWEHILHMTALIEQRKAAGTALIVVEQNLAFAERIADHYLVMDQGAVESVYRIVDVVGESATSWEEAARHAVETAATSIRDLRVAEVVKMDMKVENGKVTAFRIRVALSFKYETS
jgi:ABC-type branched-subunit amino acid transport system ATPase component